MLLIKNGTILTMAGVTYKSGCVLINKQKILVVAEKIDESKYNITKTIDAEGLWVMPGIIDAHCHIGITEEKKGFEGDDCNEMTEPITPYIRAIDGINPMDSAFHNAVCSGITSVMVGPGSSNVVGGQFAFIKTTGRSIDNMIVLAPAAMKIAFGENPKTNYNDMEKMPTTRMSIAGMLREEIFKAVQYKKENTAIRIALEFKLNLTLDHCTEGHLIADEIKQSGFPAIVGPSLASRNKIEVQNMDFKTAGILSKKGIKVAVTTDHPVTRIQYLPVCAGFAAKEGLGIEEGLKAITINAAEICNVSHRVGSLEEGKDADIAIFDGNPMETFTNTIYTLINGEVVYDRNKDMEQQKTEE
ncbi:MAG: amidohydrolase [Sedimentibacter sp.]|nr:amidohydrolase [Sedimentibacter sp.]